MLFLDFGLASFSLLPILKEWTTEACTIDRMTDDYKNRIRGLLTLLTLYRFYLILSFLRVYMQLAFLVI